MSLLLSPPTHFSIDYSINPWMNLAADPVDRSLAHYQWYNLYANLSNHTHIFPIGSQPNCPDLVFTANAGIVFGNQVIVSNFRNSERKVEEPHFYNWFKEHGYDILPWPTSVPFEGAGDALIDNYYGLIWVGSGPRSHRESSNLISKFLNAQTIPLKLVDPRFYHLDTALCPLSDGHLLYYPGAFDEISLALIEMIVPSHKRIQVSLSDALKFCCNAVNLNRFIFMNDASESLLSTLLDKHFTTILIPMSEFIKSGGSCKCLTLAI